MRAPRYSIVIPTCGRPALLGGALASALAPDRDDLEVVVSHNGTDAETTALVERVAGRFPGPGLRLVRTPRPLLMHESWRFAVDHARGRYVTVLCDDDALHPRLFEILDRVLARTGADAVSWRSAVYYAADWLDESVRGTLWFPSPYSDRTWAVDGGELIDLAYDFRILLTDWVPRLLNGIVSRTVIERASRLPSALFRPSCPDYSAMLAIALHARRMVVLDAPLAVAGAARESIGASYIVGGEAGRRFFDDLRAAPVDLAMPPVMAGVCCWIAQTLVQCASAEPALRGRRLNRVHVLGQAVREVEAWRGQGLDVADEAARLADALRGEPANVRRAVEAFAVERWRLETERFLRPCAGPEELLGPGPFAIPAADPARANLPDAAAAAAAIDACAGSCSLAGFWPALADLAGERDIVIYGLGRIGRCLWRAVGPPPDHLAARVTLHDDGAGDIPPGGRWGQGQTQGVLRPGRTFVLVTPARAAALGRAMDGRGMRRGADWITLDRFLDRLDIHPVAPAGARYAAATSGP